MTDVPDDETRYGFEIAALAALVLLSLTIIQPIDVGAVVAGTMVLIGSRMLGEWGSEAPLRARNAALAIAILFTVLGLVSGTGGSTLAATMAVLAVPAIAVGYLVLRGDLDRAGPRWAGTALLVAMVAVIAAISIGVEDRPEIDVLDLHVAAADLVAAGQNPYADLRVQDTRPAAEPGEVIVGYPYPPATMLVFAGSELLFGDPRWASVLAIGLAVVLLTRPWAQGPRQRSAALMALVLAMVLQPSMGHILRHGWTEPIAVPLIVGVGMAWRRHPVLAAVLLGLTLGLKQYWIVAVPLMLFWNDDVRWRRLTIAGGVACLTLAPAFLVGPEDAWRALVSYMMDLAPRADSIGLSGIGWGVPVWLAIAASAVVAYWMSRGGGSVPRFTLGLSASLAAAFVLGGQAFINYWFLVASMAVIAVAVELTGPLELVDDGLAAAA